MRFTPTPSLSLRISCALLLGIAFARPLAGSWVPEGVRGPIYNAAGHGLAIQNEHSQAAFFAPAIEQESTGEYIESGYTSATVGDAPTLCGPYDPAQFTRKPVKAQKWWDEQRKRDAKEAAGLLDHDELALALSPSPTGRQYFGKPYVAPAPRFVAYTCCASTDDNITYPIAQASQLKAINVFNIAFFTLEGPTAKAMVWYNMTLKERRDMVQSFHAANKSIMLSFFGGDASEEPTTKRYDPVALAKLHGEVVRESGFDGIDIDYEDFDAFGWDNYSAPYWINDYVQELRTHLPQPQYALTAAPVAPWFTPNRTTQCHGGYGTVSRLAGNQHDWYNLQYYNQGVGAYDSCDTLLFKSNATEYEQTSIFEIAENGVPLKKLVIGKPGWYADAGDGYMDPDLLGTCSATAKKYGWKGGIMSFQWPHADVEWFRTARLQSFYGDN